MYIYIMCFNEVHSNNNVYSMLNLNDFILIFRLAHLGHMFTGISAPVLFAGSPVMSATWFPPGQRATATAIMTTYSLSGTALIFLVGKYRIYCKTKVYTQAKFLSCLILAISVGLIRCSIHN